MEAMVQSTYIYIWGVRVYVYYNSEERTSKVHIRRGINGN